MDWNGTGRSWSILFGKTRLISRQRPNERKKEKIEEKKKTQKEKKVKKMNTHVRQTTVQSTTHIK